MSTPLKVATKLLSSYHYRMLPFLGVNRNIKKEWRTLPRAFGGVGLLSLPVEADHAPNVFFAVAIPGAKKLHEADTEVVVLRTMEVEVTMPAEARPGETVPIRVTTTDVHGAAPMPHAN